MLHRRTIFLLKYEDRYDSLAFYSKEKGILYKLRKVNLVPVAYNVSLNAYVTMVIEAPELEPKFRNFSKDPSKYYFEILEQICIDYKAQTIGKNTRGVPEAPS